MRRSTNKSRRWRPVLLVVLVAACAGLVSLGNWQQRRAAEKSARYEVFATRQAARPLDFGSLGKHAKLADLNWRRVRVRGHFEELYVLLDNRVQHGRPGYEVLSPFLTDDGRTVLVDRGWVPMPDSRDTPPDVLVPSDPGTIGGFVGGPPTVGISLGNSASAAELMSPQIYRVQQVDLAGLSSLLHVDLWPAVLYLDANALGALSVDWPLPGDDSGRSRAYAVQWYAMAAVLAALGLWNLYGRKRSRA